jgi:putative transposase
MSELFNNHYRISSARLAGFDYSNEGYYFVTICTKKFRKVFGEIINQKMNYSRGGIIADKQWHMVPDLFLNAKIDEFIIMPDHFHGIILIQYPKEIKQQCFLDPKICRDAIFAKNSVKNITSQHGGITGENNPMLSYHSLSKIVRWFKGSSTYQIRKEVDPDFEWQSRFWDSIVWNNEQLFNIRKYIRNNPKKWQPRM